MGLKIVNKKVVIIILGIQGGKIGEDKLPQIYNFENQPTYNFNNNSFQYFNTLPLLIDTYQKTHSIIPIYTEEARIFNEKIVELSHKDLLFNDQYMIVNEQNFDEIFSLFDNVIEENNEIIIDVTHGFRHLPILMIVDLIIQNFKNTDKIKHIWFAKEIIKHEKNQIGSYEVIDLKQYVDLANISFVLTSFDKNYTVASHINSLKYNDLIDALNMFSNDIMALNLNNLFKKSSKTLIQKLETIEDVSIRSQAENLAKKITVLSEYEGKKRYQTYYDLAKNLYEKNYILLSLALLYESIRIYIKTQIKKVHPDIVENIEKQLHGDLYKIGDFFKNLSWLDWEKYQSSNKKIQISNNDYSLLQKSYRGLNIKELYERIDSRRNNLAHANADERTFRDINADVKKLLDDYDHKCIREKTINNLIDKFNQR